ncbi:hypothetical protein [Afifella sp. IM 167]|uniref:hypothetical protein n=1 Tax=Afifella sp. IM 167 TaxID=2033586 RepID=UPI001CCF1AA9|nr:hypothetical protein [Afifella sp. IM 167]MBZ8133026.1 hypothetical protein [Afifella sp. IM 167]
MVGNKTKTEGVGTVAEEEADRFPCVLAAPRNFHLFVQDDDDVWSPTLDEINAGTYDALKLKRVSFYLDVGLPHGNPMAFAFDGSMIIPRNPHLRSADDAMDEFNRVVGAMVIGGLGLEQVCSGDLAFGSLYATGYFRYEQPHGLLPTLHQAWGEASAGGYLNIALLDPPRITKGEVQAAMASGKPVLDTAQRMDPATLVMAVSHHAAAEYRNSLLYSWLVVEQLIGQIWDDVFIPAKAASFQERIGQLRSSARTPAVRIEFLAEAGLIDRKLYRYVKRARNARNELIHKGSKPDQDDSYFSLVALTQFLELICNERGVGFEGKSLLQGVGRRRKRQQSQGVMSAEKANWPKVSHWRPLKPIPGENSWTGEYERRPGIALVRTLR